LTPAFPSSFPTKKRMRVLKVSLRGYIRKGLFLKDDENNREGIPRRNKRGMERRFVWG